MIPDQDQTDVASTTVSIGNWIVTLIILVIPFVNFIALLYWAFNNTTPPSKRNYAKAALIMILFSIILLLIVYGTVPLFLLCPTCRY